jgi:hypothetical protein
MPATTTSTPTQATTASSKTLALLDSTGKPFTASLNRLTASVTIAQGDLVVAIPLGDTFLTSLLARKATAAKVWA